MNVQGNRSLALLLALVLFLAAGVTGRAAGQSDTLQEAFQNALDRYNAANQSALVIILSGQAGRLAYATAVPQNPSDFYLVMLAKESGSGWNVLVPGESPDADYNRVLDSFPDETIDEATKALLRRPEPAPVDGPLLAAANYTGHRLPWPYGQSAYVTQRDGSGHVNQIDFDIHGKAGSGDVYATKPGTVVFVKDSSNTNCREPAPNPCWKKSNMIVVQHDSGEYTWYVHLAYRSATVSVGQRVGFGTKLGVEGNTGYSTGVHLHYMASSGHTAWTDPNNPDAAPWGLNIYPVDFDEYPWTALQVSYSTTYKSQNGANLPPVCPRWGGALLYRDANYGCAGLLEDFGYAFRNAAGFQNLTPSFDNTASSLWLPAGWSARLYEDADRGGGSVCIDAPGKTSFTGLAFDNGRPLNDAVSSFEVFQEPGCPVHFSADLTAPYGSLTSPTPGSTVGREVKLTAQAGDPQGSVRQVRFNAAWGGQERVIYTTKSQPYEFTWDLCAAGVPDGPVSLTLTITDGGWNTITTPPVQVTKSYNCAAAPGGSWSASYYAATDLSGSPKLTGEVSTPMLFLDWGSGAPGTGLPADGWSARFTRSFNFTAGNYTFHCQGAGGCRIFVDDQEQVSAWQEGDPDGASKTIHLQEGAHTVRVEFFDASGDANLEAWWQGSGYLPGGPACSSDQWCAQTWGNSRMAGAPAITRNEGETINRAWGSASPDPLLPADFFSRRFTRTAPFECGTYRFSLSTADAARLRVADTLLIDRWTDPGQETLYTAEIALPRGEHPLVIEQADLGGTAGLSVQWELVESCPVVTELQSVSNHITRPGKAFAPAVSVQVKDGYLSPARGDRLAHVSGNAFSAGPGLVREYVESGQSYTFQPSNGFAMTAPSANGSYSGTWQVQVGGKSTGATATVQVLVDGSAPQAAISPSAGYLTANQIPIQATLSDSGSGISHAQFIVGYNDGVSWAWRHLGYDTNGADGWGITWNASAVPDQSGVIFLVAAWDRAGNAVEARSSPLTLDRTPPAVSIAQPALAQDSTRFLVQWSGSDALSGLASFDVQVQVNGGGWQAWLSGVPASSRSAWFTGQMGSRYAFRARGVDAAGNSSAFTAPTQATLINTCSGDAFEPDNTPAQAVLAANGAPGQVHTLCGVGDEDWYAFTVEAGRVYMFYTTDLGATTRTVLSLFAADGVTRLAESESANGAGSFIRWQPEAGGTLYFRVRHADPQVAGNAVTYRAVAAEVNSVFLPSIGR